MIRSFSLRDAPAIWRLQTRGAAFDYKRRLLSSPHPTRSAVLGLVSGHYVGARTLVHTNRADDRPVAFVQLLPREDGACWDVSCIAPALDDRQDVACHWQDLLGQAVIMAAEQCVSRIYARPPVDGEAAAILRRCGFSMVGCEEIFVSSGRRPKAPMPPNLREVRDGDAFALSELRRQVIPPLVYQAQWFGPEEAASSARAGNGYVWVEEGALVAHMALESTGRGHWIECIVRPGRRGDLLPYLRWLMYMADGEGSRPIYVAVPDYTVGLGWLLRMLGFESLGRQQVMVAHTVSRVTVARPAVAHGLEGGVDMVAH